ncbi:MAG: Holliday junction branch migration protein RuvA [Clostridia bacterium]|nr:Holliday junction branch migration protein RuvA [Clostridia bacterium]
MIAYIKGKLLYVEDNSAVLESNGIGYELICSSALKYRLMESGGGEAFTYLSVREDGVSLFGFDSRAEKNMFLKLISVSGIGPKMAIGILSGISLNDLVYAIAASDVKTLSKIKGLGKKTAERLILELREVLSTGDEMISETNVSVGGDGEDAIIALIGLGYSRQQASAAVKSAIDGGAKGLEDIITKALRHFA